MDTFTNFWSVNITVFKLLQRQSVNVKNIKQPMIQPESGG